MAFGRQRTNTSKAGKEKDKRPRWMSPKAIAKHLLPLNTRWALRRFFYFGRRFRCPVCNSTVRTLFDAGYDIPILHELKVVGGFRPEDTCPVCWSHARHRLLWGYLTKEYFPNTLSISSHVLHVAPEGPLVNLFRARPEIAYIAADLDPMRYREVGRVIFADIISLPWHDNIFDLILCNHVLEHVPNDRKAMKELYRVMRPGGMGIVQVPFARNLPKTIEDPFIKNPVEQEHRFGQRDHVRVYGLDYIERLEHAGFKVEIFDPIISWDRETVDSLLLDPEEKLFIALKRE